MLQRPTITNSLVDEREPVAQALSGDSGQTHICRHGNRQAALINCLFTILVDQMPPEMLDKIRRVLQIEVFVVKDLEGLGGCLRKLSLRDELVLEHSPQYVKLPFFGFFGV